MSSCHPCPSFCSLWTSAMSSITRTTSSGRISGPSTCSSTTILTYVVHRAFARSSDLFQCFQYHSELYNFTINKKILQSIDSQ
ncbi:hypothetical protein GBAR_LOCUS19008 [Geodia barretti]|uniref:Uncharacterized protein n=1 Tax=Geodia barretti TaxID=519541 RepID=A0AA35SR25_GEOBA|nr:hypothetical protein GBAR_LOCUS19008 [Geodia barretti]